MSHLDRWSLRFPDDIEREFRDEYFARSLGHVRFALVAGLLIYGAFGAWDGMVGGEARGALWLIRFGIGCPVFLLAFAASFTAAFKRWMQPVLSAVMLVAGFSLLAMLVASPQPLQAHSYYPGVMLVLIYTQTFMKLRFWHATAVAWTIIAGYQVVAIRIVDLPLPVVGHNDYFLVACACVGTIVCYGLEHYVRQEFLLRFDNVAMLRALTEQRNAAERANVAKSKFLAAASHDLRQPVHALGLFVTALRERAVDPGVQQLVDRIEASVHAMDGLFNALLDISKLDAGVVTARPVAFALAPLLARIENDYAAQARAKGLRFSVRGSPAWVASDPALLELVLRNLAANAVRYTERGGIVIACRPRGGSVAIEVWDSGRGIPADQHREIFEEFCQLDNAARDRSKGLGLGLAIVKRLCALLDHPIRLSSEVGRGSRFTVDVPLAEAAELPAPVDAGTARLKDSIPGSFVLVIDDEAGVRESMQLLLGGWGCYVLAVASGRDAVQRLEAYDRVPDLILSDYRLGDGETGPAAIRAVCDAIGQAVPAVLVTGDTAPERLREAGESGYRLLHKPVLPETLRWIVACTASGVCQRSCRLNEVAHRICDGACPAAIDAAALRTVAAGA